jgi:hypothetical protein
MKDFHDKWVRRLYYLILDPQEPMINQNQKIAIEFLAEKAATGNTDAIAALNKLLRQPFLHPALREMVNMALTPMPMAGDQA